MPTYNGTLRSHLLNVPECIYECSGICIFGRRIKSLVFSTDIAIIKNINTDAVIAVYPFTPQPSIAQAIMEDPDILVLDEPMNALDEEGVEEIRQLLLEYKQPGRCILITSHNREDIEILCDEVFEIKSGILQ